MKKYSKKTDYSYSLGTSLSLELLDTQIQHVLKVYISSKQKKNNTLARIISICQANGIEAIYNDRIFSTLSDKENCFVIGVFNKYKSRIDKADNHIVLVKPSNNGNLGTIIRTAIGFGINNLAIIKPAVDIYDPKVIRASMGAFFHMNFQYFDSFQQYYSHNKTNTIYPFMLQSNNNLKNTEIKTPYSLIFGNEATGLEEEFLNIGFPIRINHNDRIDSLNLDNAVSIALYEFTKGNF